MPISSPESVRGSWPAPIESPPNVERQERRGCGEAATGEASMVEVSIIGLDLAKTVFRAHGAAADGSVDPAGLRQAVREATMATRQTNPPAIGMLSGALDN